MTMNSNGLRLAEDVALCRELAELGVYVILSVNTLDRAGEPRMHGCDLVDVKLRAIENLTRAGAKMTLLNVMIRGENEDAAGGTSGAAADDDNMLSLTMQTMTYTGQGGGTFPRARHIPVDEAARMVLPIPAGGSFDDFITRPSAHPLCYLICYLLQSGEQLHPLAQWVPREAIEKLLGDSYLIRPGEDDRLMRDVINRLYAEGRDAELAVLRDLVTRLFPTGDAAGRFPAAASGRVGRADHPCPRPHGRGHIRLLTGDALSGHGGRRAGPADSRVHVWAVSPPARQAFRARTWAGPRSTPRPPLRHLAVCRPIGHRPVPSPRPASLAGPSASLSRSVIAASDWCRPRITSDTRDVYFQKFCPVHGDRRALSAGT